MKIMPYKKKDKEIYNEIIAQRMRFLKCVRCESTNNLRPYLYRQVITTQKVQRFKINPDQRVISGEINVPVCENCYNLFKKSRTSKLEYFVKYDDKGNFYVRPAGSKRWFIYQKWIKSILEEHGRQMCLNCEAIIEKDDQFCKYCGEKKMSPQEYQVQLRRAKEFQSGRIEDDKAWLYEGNDLYKIQDYEGAIKCYDKALKINPNFAEAKRNKQLALKFLSKR